MAYLEKRNQIYRIVFRLDGKRFSRSLETKNETSANLALAKLNDGLHRLKLGLLQIEAGDDAMTVLLSSGTVRTQPTVQRSLQLGHLLDEYFSAIPKGSLEENSLGMLGTHIKNFKRHLGSRLSTQRVNLAKLQEFVNARSKDPGIRGGNVSPVTIRKEITTLHAAWTWAIESGSISITLPRKALLRYPKQKQKPPFKTWDEIVRLIERGSISESKQREHWDCLFLNEKETFELLLDIGKQKAPLCIQTMVTAAAYLGARRSELLRSRIEDVDLELNKFTIREKKRVRSQHSTRAVPICAALRKSLVKWMANHPGGEHTFSIDANPITRNQAHDYFTRALKNTKWRVVRGWHCLRHSFISNCAAKNLDQRIIDDWTGHQTAEMRERYRHLFPNIQQAAIESVFNS